METDVQSSGQCTRRLSSGPAALLLGLAGITSCLLLAVALWQHGREDAEQAFLIRHQQAFEAIVDALENSTALTSQLGRAMAASSADRTSLFNALAAESGVQTDHLDLAAWIEPMADADTTAFRLAAVQTPGSRLDTAAAEKLLIDAHAGSLRRAVDGGTLTMSGGPVLLPDTNGVRAGQLLLQPVFRSGDALEGVVATVIGFDSLLDTHPERDQVSLHLFEESPANGRNLPLYSSQSGNTSPTPDRLDALPHLQRSLKVGDRVWSTWLVPSGPLATHWSLSHWLPLAAMLALTLGLTAVAQTRGRKCRAIEQRCGSRETQLAQQRQINDKLQRDNRQLDAALQRARTQSRSQGIRLREQMGRDAGLEQEAWLFQRAFDDAAAAMALFDPDTGICFRANLAFCELLGYSSGELTGLDFRQFTHPADIERTPRLVRSALRGGQHRFRAEKRYLHRSGRVVWCEVAGALLRDREGRPLYLAIQAHDITAHRGDRETPAPEEAIISPQ